MATAQRRIGFVEVGPSDGLQNESRIFSELYFDKIGAKADFSFPAKFGSD